MRRRPGRLLLLLLALGAAGCGGAPRYTAGPVAEPRAVQHGKASYYHDSLHGNRTASGVPYDRNALTAAHRTLPFGTEIAVENLANGRTVRVTVNDRGPFVSGRIVDLSRRAAAELGMLRDGVVDVALRVVSLPD
jgi:rare lipoprotein A